MTRQILILLLLFMFVGCKTTKEKTAHDIETEVLSYDIKNPMLGKGYLSGMTKLEVYKNSKTLETNDELYVLEDSSIISQFETENFILTNHTVFYYYQGLLYKKVSQVLTDSVISKGDSESDLVSELLVYLKKHYGDDCNTNGTQNSKYYWVEDGVRIDLFDTLDKVHIAFTDILIERAIISDNNRAKREMASHDKEMAL